jgi:glycosyltransferase involved in cell wall biosynthesis
MNKQPLISVITATYNAELLLEKTIKSIVNQQYGFVEYIIIDAASTDGTLEIIEKYKNNIQYFKSEPDDGIYDAWNKGIKIANGEWIAFLGAGDEYLPDALQNYVIGINRANDDSLEFISSMVEIVNNQGNKLYHIGTKWEWPKYLDYMNAAHVGSLHSKKLFNKYGEFNTSYKISGDYELLLRPGPDLKAGFIPVVTAKMLFGGMSASYKSLEEVFRIKLTSGYLSSTKVYGKYYLSIFKAWARYTLYKMGIYVSIRK